MTFGYVIGIVLFRVKGMDMEKKHILWYYMG